MRSSRIKFLSACIVCSSANPLSTSQKSISAATRRRPGRSAQAVAVNCGYWTKAIALKRVPEHLHICSQAAIALWRCPASRAPSATNSVAPLKDLPFCKPSRWLQHTVKMWLRPLRQVFSPLGRTWGPRRDALGLSHLTYETTRTISCHQLDQPPFPCSLNVSPDSSHVNKRFWPN